jgi:hypothetical protein
MAQAGCFQWPDGLAACGAANLRQEPRGAGGDATSGACRGTWGGEERWLPQRS